MNDLILLITAIFCLILLHIPERQKDRHPS